MFFLVVNVTIVRKVKVSPVGWATGEHGSCILCASRRGPTRPFVLCDELPDRWDQLSRHFHDGLSGTLVCRLVLSHISSSVCARNALAPATPFFHPNPVPKLCHIYE